ncbi:DUF4325 domain-containing protein [Brevundimonas sp. LPMIX5]|uniref:STAS-like domain-containing protein n=1 Tax=Brevundimonas sp. LPMIX5 TaxID=2305887 RepID=UPI000E6744F8|nr:STAS-like domain-containing protein [Brevundimonas sp. LPMIX5]RIJ65154.1 DUF4325 domain-containing protein [Brevundimonas sp. LPMIX5]
MNQPVRVSITEIVGSSICVSIDDGNRLHEQIIEHIHKHRPVALSFYGVNRLTTAFLNAAVGQLYNEFTEDEVRARLAPPQDASPEQLALLKRVVDNAKRFFQERQRIADVMGTVRGDG